MRDMLKDKQGQVGSFLMTVIRILLGAVAVLILVFIIVGLMRWFMPSRDSVHALKSMSAMIQELKGQLDKDLSKQELSVEIPVLVGEDESIGPSVTSAQKLCIFDSNSKERKCIPQGTGVSLDFQRLGRKGDSVSNAKITMRRSSSDEQRFEVAIIYTG
jgi:hypothetical protein